MTEDDLLDAVAEAPNDDGPRLVYADWLQQHADEARRAYGEFIALSCTTVRPKPTRKINELFARHGNAWLGPVAPLLETNHAWSRGFLDACTARTLTDPPKVEPALEHPAWCVLRAFEIESSSLSVESLADLICQRRMANLRSLQSTTSVLRLVVESAHAPRLRELGAGTAEGDLSQLGLLLTADCFVRLRRLHLFGLSPSALRQLMRPELELIVIVARIGSLGHWIAELDALRAPLAEVRLTANLYERFERRGCEAILSGDGTWNKLEVRWGALDEARWRDELIATLARLPAGAIERLSFVGPPVARFDVARFQQHVMTALPDAVVE